MKDSMDKKFLQYSVDELLQDSSFIFWAFHKRPEQNWDRLVKENPDFKEKVDKAKKIIGLLNDLEDQLSEHEIYYLWKQIDQFYDLRKNDKIRIRYRKIYQYAAIFIVGLLIAGASFYFIESDSNYQFAENTETQNESILILPNGNEVNLKKDNSTVDLVSSNNEIHINSEQVVDLQATMNEEDKAKMNEVIIPFGKRSELLLADGTKVWLNAGSRLAFPSKFKGKKREVFLEGEAYFEVIHNKEKPFHVNTNEIKINVLGTRFNISAYNNDKSVETVLLDGKVAIREHSTISLLTKKTELVPGQKASYSKETDLITVKNEENPNIYIAWIEGWFEFKKEILPDILNKLERYYNVKFEISKEIKSDELITGKLDITNSLQKVLTALSDVSNTNFQIIGNKVIVTKK